MRNIGLTLISDAQSEPVSLSEAKALLAIDTLDTANDALITALIVASRKFCENYTGRAFITQTWDFFLDELPSGSSGSLGWWDGVREGPLSLLTGAQGVIELPKAPFQSLVSVTAYGTDDQPSSFDITTLVQDPDSTPGRIFPKIGTLWPVNLRYKKAIQVRFKAGYGDSSSSVPADLIQAIKLMMAHFFENRQIMIESRVSEAPLSARALLDHYKVRSL